MIIVHITPGGVRDVQIQALNDLFQDFDLALWPLVREELGRLDRRIKKATKKTLDTAKEEGL